MKKAKAELGLDAEVDEDLVRVAEHYLGIFFDLKSVLANFQVKKIARTASSVLVPLASIFGGIVGQEVAKAVTSNMSFLEKRTKV